MGYTKQTFVDLETVVKAENFNHIEDGIVAIDALASAKQDKLVSGENIKTINGISLLGSGDIDATADSYFSQLDISNEKSDDIAWGLCDSNGKFVIKVDNDGVITVGNLKANYINTSSTGGKTSWIAGKKCFVLGDSLSADTRSTGSWHQQFCKATGAILDPDLNRGWFSIGGTATIGTHTEGNACCQMRAKRLVEYYKQGNEVDVIFVQNVNDINNNMFSAGIHNKGTSSDLPFFENQVITYTNKVVETSSPSVDVLAYFKENFETILDGVTPMTGTVIDMLYTVGGTAAKELKITHAPTADGDIILNMKHGANYRVDSFPVHVTAGMSIEDVVAAIVDWQFVGVSTYEDVIGENGDSVVFSSPYSLEFDGGSTGVTAEVTSTGAVTRYPIAFKSLNIDSFSDVTSWDAERSVTYWSAQKGLIEYLQTNIPNAKIFYLILPYYRVTYPATSGSAYLREDGSFNMEYWVENGRGSSSAEKLYTEQPLVANYYGCASIDVINNCSISPVNIQSFYPSNDVHPKTEGYNVWGDTIAQLLTGE